VRVAEVVDADVEVEAAGLDGRCPDAGAEGVARDSELVARVCSGGDRSASGEGHESLKGSDVPARVHLVGERASRATGRNDRAGQGLHLSTTSSKSELMTEAPPEEVDVAVVRESLASRLKSA
jgi:hypothetical protein